jgi:hypothetical protein
MATSARWRSLFDVRNRASRVYRLCKSIKNKNKDWILDMNMKNKIKVCTFEVERIVASIAETDDVVFWGIFYFF